MIINIINECICCAECYTVSVTNNNAVSVDLSGVFVCGDGRDITETILAGSTTEFCVTEQSYWATQGASGLLVDVEFVNCDCPL